MTLSRRKLLANASLAAGAAAVSRARADEPKPDLKDGKGAPAPDAKAAPVKKPGPRALVILQLEGGNDGLNTVPPMADPLYKKLRPGLALAPSEVLDLDGKLALHGAMGALHARLKARGDVAIVTGVHYPNSNRSHFESTAIWQTARMQPHLEAEGWAGRALEGSQLGPFGMTSVGGGALTPAFYAQRAQATVLSSLDAFQPLPDKRAIGDAPALFAALRALYAGDTRDPGDAIVRGVGQVALAASERLRAAAAGYQSMANFPRSAFGDQLRLASQMLVSDLDVRAVHCTLGSFDTHSNQRPTHRNLLQNLSDGVVALLEDTAAHGLEGRVTVMTYSEFGRRAAENASNGSDHGSASVMFLAGAGVRGGLHGTPPDLAKLVEGDVPITTDFRAVYASVVRDLLGGKPERQLVQGIEGITLFA